MEGKVPVSSASSGDGALCTPHFLPAPCLPGSSVEWSLEHWVSGEQDMILTTCFFNRRFTCRAEQRPELGSSGADPPHSGCGTPGL